LWVEQVIQIKINKKKRWLHTRASLFLLVFVDNGNLLGNFLNLFHHIRCKFFHNIHSFQVLA
jgi:hypothetical protein